MLSFQEKNLQSLLQISTSFLFSVVTICLPFPLLNHQSIFFSLGCLHKSFTYSNDLKDWSMVEDYPS